MREDRHAKRTLHSCDAQGFRKMQKQCIDRLSAYPKRSHLRRCPTQLDAESHGTSIRAMPSRMPWRKLASRGFWPQSSLEGPLKLRMDFQKPTQVPLKGLSKIADFCAGIAVLKAPLSGSIAPGGPHVDKTLPSNSSCGHAAGARRMRKCRGRNV